MRGPDGGQPFRRRCHDCRAGHPAPRLGGRQLGHLNARGAVVIRAEDVGCIAIKGPDHNDAAVNRHGDAKLIVFCRVGSLQFVTKPYVVLLKT